MMTKSVRKETMPDISMCKGDKCSAKLHCWRFLAPPAYRQSYFGIVPGKDSMCEWYWKATREEKQAYIERNLRENTEEK